MDPIAKNFVRASLVYLFIGACLGLLQMYVKDEPLLKFAHVHFGLLGWMSMMIYGVGYHILPRFSGNPVAYPGLMNWHFWLANISLIGLCGVWGYADSLAKLFAALQVVAVGMFVFNILASIGAAPAEG
ncbi:MAG TPA: hypothetical protein ACFYD3_04010 [Candidatus Hypogeohydataceae bacterium YC41]